MAWLRADMDDQDKSIVLTLWCVVCRKYKTRMCGLKNFSRAWISGSSNHKASVYCTVSIIMSGQHSVMADQVALWSDKVQAAVKKLFSSLIRCFKQYMTDYVCQYRIATYVYPSGRCVWLIP